MEARREELFELLGPVDFEHIDFYVTRGKTAVRVSEFCTDAIFTFACSSNTFEY